MPTYNYKCNSCDAGFSVFQGINDNRTKKCVKCSSEEIERLITGGTGMIFKGDGFYLTDYTNYGKKNIDTNNKGKNDDSKSKNSK